MDLLYGRSAEAMASIDRILTYLHKDDRDPVMENVQRAIDTGAEFDHEFRVTWPDGSLHWVAGRGRKLSAADGRSARMVGINWNITARKEAEEGLSIERSRLTELFEQAPAFIATVRGPNHLFEMVNHSYQKAGRKPRSHRPIRARSATGGGTARFRRAAGSGLSDRRKSCRARRKVLP